MADALIKIVSNCLRNIKTRRLASLLLTNGNFIRNRCRLIYTTSAKLKRSGLNALIWTFAFTWSVWIEERLLFQRTTKCRMRWSIHTFITTICVSINCETLTPKFSLFSWQADGRYFTLYLIQTIAVFQIEHVFLRHRWWNNRPLISKNRRVLVSRPFPVPQGIISRSPLHAAQKNNSIAFFPAV